jgi:hypothetical protein
VNTLAQLEAYPGHGLALSFVIEGFGSVFSTAPPADMAGTYSADAAPYSSFPDPVGQMVVGGLLQQSINLYDPDIKPESVTVTIVDRDLLLLGALFKARASTGHQTYLTANVVAGSTAAIAVKDTTGFAASGTLYIGGEAVGYTAKTATTFTGITRGLFTVNQTNGGTAFAPSHLIGNNVSVSVTTAPAVSDFQRTWYGRFCHIFLHARDPLTGAYNKASEALRIFSGRLEVPGDDLGDGRIQLVIKSALDLLNKPLGPDQWRANISNGQIFDSKTDTMTVYRQFGAIYYVAAHLGLSVTQATSHQELADAMNAIWRANVWAYSLYGGAVAAGDVWSISLIETQNGPRYRISLDANTTPVADNTAIQMYMHESAFDMLGFEFRDTNGWKDGLGNVAANLVLNRQSSSRYDVIAARPPISYYNVRPTFGQKLAVGDEVNTFVSQTPADFAADGASVSANGCVQMLGGRNEGLYLVKYTSGSPSKIEVTHQFDYPTGKFTSITLLDDTPNGVIRVGEPGDVPPTVKQVIYYRGPAGALLLRCLLSTGGASGYNHAAYDTLTTAGFGAGIPASLVDVESWETLNDATIELLVTEPKPFYELLEPVLAMTGSYVVWKAADASSQPKLAIVNPSLDTAYLATWQLNETNKCSPDERPRVTHALDGIVTRLVIKAGHGVSEPEQASVTISVEHLAAQSDFGKRRTVTLNAGAVLNYEALIQQVLQPALTYFARPLAIAERSYTGAFARMAPADSVTLIDNYVADPATGTRGAIIYAWVLGTSFDLESLQGRARLVFMPEKSPNFTAPWAPSARVDETAGGGGYNAGSRELTLKPHEFSEATAATLDYQRFSVGDKVRVVQLDAAAPLEWFDDIATVPGTNRLGLTAGLAGFVAGNRYVIEFDDLSTVVAGQRDVAYLADATTLSTGYAPAPLPFEWGGGNIAVAGATVDYTVGTPRPETRYDDQGEPLSIHKQTYLVKGANAQLAYRTRNVLYSDYFGDRSQTGTTDRLILSFFVPFFGHHGESGTRRLKVKVRGRQAGGGTATFTVASSHRRPTGDTYTAFEFPGGFAITTITTTSATDVWSAEATLEVAVTEFLGRGNRGTWISLYIHGSAGGITATVNQLWVAEEALT